MKKTTAAFFVFVLVLFLGACVPIAAGPQEAPAGKEPPVSGDESAPVEAEASAESAGVAFIDASGNELNLQSPPERIVIAGRASQMILHAAYLFPEAVERIVGMEQRAQRKISMLPLVDPDFDGKTQLERDAAAEQIAPLQPEAVIMKTYMAERLGDPLNQLDIPVVYMDLETPDQFLRDVEGLGELFANPGRAGQVKSFYLDRLAQVETGLAGLGADERPSVLLLQYDNRGGEVAFNVPSTDWLQTQMVELAGGEPVWVQAAEGGGWTVVNLEQVAAWDPDMIFIVNYFGDPGEAASELRQDPIWAALRAVQEDNLFAFPGDYLSWDQPDTRWILGLQWLASVLHPQRFESLDMEGEVLTFYEDLYGLDAGIVEREVLPLITGDFEQ